MKVEVKKLESGKKEIHINVSGEMVKNKFEEVFKAITKEAKVPGFRQGHAPRDVIEKNFSSHAHEQVLKELVPDLYGKAVEQEKIDVVDLPEISEVNLDRGSLSFKATVEIYPEIKLKEYKKIALDYKKAEVTDDDVKRHLDSIKESRKAEALDDSFAKGLGYPSFAELEKAVKQSLTMSKENEARQKREDQVVEYLLKMTDFKLPEAMVARQLEEMTRQAKVNLAMKGFPRDKIEEQQEVLRKDLEPQARKQVKLYLIFAEIAKKESIANDDQMPQKVLELLLREAEWKNEA